MDFDSQIEQEESMIDEDLDQEYQDLENRELVQALGYDRAFVTNGPIVRVYENRDLEAEDSDFDN
jgi:hypothetical protein